VKHACSQCPHSALCLAYGFDVIFNAAALQFASKYLGVADETCSTGLLKRGARNAIMTVQQVLPQRCPNLQPECLIQVKMGVEVNGPVVEVVL